MSELHVACAADEAYAPHLATMLHSALHSGGRASLHVHLLRGPELSRRSTRRIAGMVKRAGAALSTHRIHPRQVEGLPTLDFISSATWFRLFLTELLPGVERVLYLDSDLVVVSSLDPLLEFDLADHYLAAVTNVFEPYYAHRPADLGLSGPEAYFNAGVLLLNLELMRADGIGPALREYAFAHREELLWSDQDALNVVLGSRRLPLHPRWNCMNSVIDFAWSADVFGAQAVEEARTAPAIRHFEGPSVNKPWHPKCERKFRSLYFEHRAGTPWSRLDGPPSRRPRLLTGRLRP
ncbi:MAG: glycosyltransferase family 8 protein [Thermoleophilaceae bacterium]